MKKFKKWILGTLCAVCTALLGVATVELRQEVKADAAVATEYTIVDTPMMMKISDQSPSEGRFNLFICMPQIDTNINNGYLKFDGVDLMSVFNEFNFFNNVKIGEKTLTELGITAFWDNKIGYGEGEPNGIIRLHCIADATIWQTAIQNGEVQFDDNQTPITIEKGTLVPGYTYLSGAEDAVVYRANMTYVTERNTPLTYSYVTSGMTDVDSVRYVQGHDGKNGYIGISLKGDDYLRDSANLELKDYYNKLADVGNPYDQKVLVNGESGKVSNYALYNLGQNGQGYFSFVIYPTEEDTNSITIPAGTVFPVSVSLMDSWKGLNSGNFVYVVYKTTTEKTFIKNASGVFTCFDGYPEEKTEELMNYRAAKEADAYFAGDLASMDAAVASALELISVAETVEEVDAAFDAAKLTIDSFETKAVAKENAKAALNGYKAEEGYYRDAEAAARQAMIDEVQDDIDNATSKQELDGIVKSVQAGIDTLKTAAQYADEELAGVKAAAREEIENYLKDEVYLAEEAGKRQDSVDKGLTAIRDAKNEAEIALAVENAKAEMVVLETKDAVLGIAEEDLCAYKADEVYRDAQKEERQNAIDEALNAFAEATSRADVNAAVDAAKAKIDALKTKAELDAEDKEAADKALADEKAEARVKLNELKAAIRFDEYSTENKALINDLYLAAQQAIESALTSEAITAAVTTFETEIAKIAKLDANTDDNDGNKDADTEEEKGSIVDILKEKVGCSSVLGGMIGGVAALGLAVVALLKKKEN